jgi:hypothetical protein
MKLMIKHKFIGVVLGAVAISVLVMAIVIIVEKGSLDSKITKEMDILARENTGQIALAVYNLCKAADSISQGAGKNSERISNTLPDFAWIRVMLEQKLILMFRKIRKGEKQILSLR